MSVVIKAGMVIKPKSIMLPYGLGGDYIVQYNSYKYHVYTTTGSNTFQIFNKNLTTDILIVGGGGGGSCVATVAFGGGGGAGGLVYFENLSLDVGYYQLFVGNGGAGGNVNTATNGESSSFMGVISLGGGRGGGSGLGATNGFAGGSGGGAGGRATSLTQKIGGIGQQSIQTPGVGYGCNGGRGVDDSPLITGAGGGGGGADAAGQDAQTNVGGDGGDGIQIFAGFKISSRSSQTYGDYYSGGGGGHSTANAGSGGKGGGGDATQSGISNSGGGGGGGNGSVSGNGGSGIVIIRYPI